MKTAVITNTTSQIQFNEDFLELAAHYTFVPKACNPRAAWEKGRVEKAVRYIRDRFFAARTFSSLDDLNEQLETWLVTVSDKRAWPDDTSKSVEQAFREEKLVSCNQPFDPYEQLYVRVDKKAFISFDTNKYPVPPEHVGRKLELRATHDEIRLIWEGETVATYSRSWEKHQKIHCAGHQESIAELRSVTRNRRRSAIENTLSCGAKLLQEWHRIGESLSHQSKNVLELIEGYGLEEVEAACGLALENGTPRSCSIEQILMHSNPAPLPKLKLPEAIANIEIDHRSMSEFDELYES